MRRMMAAATWMVTMATALGTGTAAVAADEPKVTPLMAQDLVGTPGKETIMQAPAENALALQLFLLMVATPLMLLAVAIDDERRSKEALHVSEERMRRSGDGCLRRNARTRG